MQHTATAPAEPALQAAHAADDTEVLTRAIARGDTRAFGVLYERWFDRSYAVARRLTGRDEAFCLDVVQDAMMKAARRVPRLANEAALGAWLGRVVHRAALDRLRSERRRVAREQRRMAAAPEALADTQTGLADQIDWLRGRMRELSKADQSLLAARFSRDRSLAQAGREQGLTGDAAHGRIRRVLRSLQQADPAVGRKQA